MKKVRTFYFPPDVKSDNLVITGIGVQEGMPPSMINRPKGTYIYLFMYFYEEFHLKVEKEIWICAPNQFVLWKPGSPQLYGHPDKKWNHTWIRCGGRWMDQIISSLAIPLDRPCKMARSHFVDKLLLELHEEIHLHSRPDEIILRNGLENLFREVCRAAFQQEAQKAPEVFIRIKTHLESNFDKKIPLWEMADMACLSVPHFCRSFKKYFNTSPVDYLIRLRMEYAAHLLGDLNLNVGEIAKMAGYDDIYYFSKLFKKYYGKSPSKMRS
jgi:AraC-like DNA-binding protein